MTDVKIYDLILSEQQPKNKNNETLEIKCFKNS